MNWKSTKLKSDNKLRILMYDVIQISDSIQIGIKERDIGLILGQISYFVEKCLRN